jgi:glycosyltransferase involved in cell wall biosynthesis
MVGSFDTGSQPGRCLGFNTGRGSRASTRRCWATETPTQVGLARMDPLKIENCEPEAGCGERQWKPGWIICISDLQWDEHWSSEQQLMSRLSDRCRVLYVDRPVSLFSFFTGSSDTSVGRQFWRSLKGEVRHYSNTLTILTIPPVLPFRFVQFVNKINEFIRLRSIRRALKNLGVSDAALWVYAPDAGEIVGKLGESVSLYYCADEWAASDQWWNRASDIRDREGELASKVDLIVGTSTKIVKKWVQSHKNTILVTNGADVNSFKLARDANLEVPADLRAIPEPRIGYIGFIDGRFDVALYQSLSMQRPDWSFVIVGPLNERNLNLSVLRKRPNLHFLGPRTRAELPGYLKGFDVCTIPYICNTLSESIFPLKLFEYLAAGRPVVATPLPELLPFAAYVRIAGDHDEFRKSLELSLSSPLPSASEAFLNANSWDAKVDFLWERLQQIYSLSADAQFVTGSN